MLDLATDPAVEALLAGFPVRTVRGRHGVFSFREQGVGRPLVLLHGIGSGSGSWVHQLEGLGHRYRVVAWDAPGYGQSSLLAGSPRAADYAAALGDFLDAVGVVRAAIIGHSLGALMAAAFARLHADRVDRLVFASPASGYAHESLNEREQRIADRLAAFDGIGQSDGAQQWAHRLLSPAASAEQVALVAWNVRRLGRDGYAQAVRMLVDGDLSPDLAAWPRPLLVISGTADKVTPEAKCRAVAAAAQHGRYRSIAGVGHALPVEAASTVNAILVSELEMAS